MTCGGAVNLTCSGSPTAASFHLAGNDNALVTVSSPSFNLTSGGNTLTVHAELDQPAVNLGAAGSTTGVDVDLGGSIDVGSATPEGVYTGTWTVTADYQ